MSRDPRGRRWPTRSTTPAPVELTGLEQHVLMLPGARERAAELGYIEPTCSARDWELIVTAGARGFDKVMILRGAAPRAW